MLTRSRDFNTIFLHEIKCTCLLCVTVEIKSYFITLLKHYISPDDFQTYKDIRKRLNISDNIE